MLKRIKDISVAKGITVSCAESCTGGYISHLLTSISGSSLFYRGCVVAYHRDIKVDILGVSERDISLYTVVSPQVAIGMAKGAAKLFKTVVGLSSTGIAGPTGGMPGKPVGTVCLGIYSPWKTFSETFVFSGDRLSVIKEASQEAVRMLLSLLEDLG